MSSDKAKETASNTMAAIRKKMMNLRESKEQSAQREEELKDRVEELNAMLKERDDEILQLGKRVMHIENDLDETSEKLTEATLQIEEAEKQQKVNEEEVAAYTRRCRLTEDDLTRSEARLAVETQKLTEAATEAEKVEVRRKVLEAKNMVNEQRIDSLNSQIIVAQEVALLSTKNAEEASRKLAMTQVELERTSEKAADCKVHIQEMEEQLNIVGQNMKALEASETAALKSHEDYEETIRNMSLRLKFAEIQAASAEREAARLQNELDILLDDVDDWKAKYEEICEELEHTFYEMSEY